MHIPLAERMRPQRIEDYIGQQHLVGEKGFLRGALQAKLVPSMILWGPPGVGKTTLANLMSKAVDVPFYSLSAINSGVKEVREVIAQAEKNGLFNRGTPILFIDEIHRFSKSQQDALLGAVERGTITLIGATTENPSFEVIPALRSRAQTYVLQQLSKADLVAMVDKALAEDTVLKNLKLKVLEYEALLAHSGGDGRKLYNLLELVVNQPHKGELVITNAYVASYLQEKTIAYDKGGEQHYDVISAFIKSVRGSDPNGALYWLGRMLAGGEDAKFIARRLLILASEDIGNANPTALIMANNCFQALERIGMPEGRIILGQCTTYLAASPKSNASYIATDQALAKAKETSDLPVPLPLRNAPTQLMKELNYGMDYHYAHNYPGNFYPQEFLPNGLEGTVFYDPGQNEREAALRRYLKSKWGEKYGY
ncbi:MAG: replication-associated recombination protein A [Schleiferiaceae bacterium]|nr:replication-associated recombination protein A [Schleiferiaceae bacterium]